MFRTPLRTHPLDSRVWVIEIACVENLFEPTYRLCLTANNTAFRHVEYRTQADEP
jgi:hypothetical protein